MNIRYELANKKHGEIVVAEHLKDLVEYMEDRNITDEDVVLTIIKKEVE